MGGDRKASTIDQATDTGAVPATSAKPSTVTALAVAQPQVVDAQRTVDLLALTAAEMKTNADNRKACYFEAHAHALELAIDRETAGLDLDTALVDANEDLPTLEYKYRTAGAAANRAETAATNATNKLQQLTRRLAKITPKETRDIEVAVKRIVTPPSEMPAATAEKMREWGRATIQLCRLMFAANGTCQV